MSKRKAAGAVRSTTATKRITTQTDLPPLLLQVQAVLRAARQQAQRSVNRVMVEAYWHVGRLIVADEQAGQARAAYGARVLDQLAERLTGEFGTGFSAANLRNFRQFHLTFSWDEICDTPCSELSWSHWRSLMRLPDATARRWYATETQRQGWSVAALQRQMGTLYDERLLSSQDKAAIQAEANALVQREARPDPRDFIRDPYVLDFLGAQPGASLYERDLEQGLLNQLQKFLLELGKGFAFVARQQHLRVEGEDAFVDLVFYNFILKCFVLVELKVGKLSHQDVGQLDMYVRVWDERQRSEGDGPTIGLILCSERNDAVARYSRLADGGPLCASRYQAWLPSEAELQAELARDRALWELGRAEGEA